MEKRGIAGVREKPKGTGRGSERAQRHDTHPRTDMTCEFSAISTMLDTTSSASKKGKPPFVEPILPYE